MKKLLIILALFAHSAFTQTTVHVIDVPNIDPAGRIDVVAITVPAPDGTTIKDNGKGVWSCVQGGVLPSSPTFDVITANEIILGKSIYADGTYLASVKSGILTFIPYIAPTTSTPTPATGVSYTVAASSMASYGEQLIKVPVVLTKGQIAVATPVLSMTPSLTNNAFHPYVYIKSLAWPDSTGQLWLYIGNGNGAVFPASTWTVVVK